MEAITEAATDKKRFQLYIDEEYVQSGSVPVRWCVDPKLFEKYNINDLKRMKVLIVVLPKDANPSSRKELRKLVPILDLMTYIEFRTPGENLVYASLLRIGDDREDGNRIIAKFMTRVDGRWATDVLHHSREWNWEKKEYGPYRYETVNDYFFVDGQSARITVTMPEEIFAKPPPEWEQRIVNHMWRDPPIDQCDFRRRRMIAWPIMPFYIAWLVLTRGLLAIWGTLMFVKGVKWRAVINPLTYTFPDVMSGTENTVFSVFKPFKDNGPPIITIQLAPGVWLPLAGVVALVSPVSVGMNAFIWAFPVVLGITIGAYLGGAAIFLLMAIVIGIGHGLGFIGKKAGSLEGPLTRFVKWLFKKKPEAVKELTEKEKAEQERIKRVLTCDMPSEMRVYSGPTPMVVKKASVRALPKEYQSFRLKFEDLKTKVCKPFAR